MPVTAEDESALDYTERLRRLAINDAQFAEDCVGGAAVESLGLDLKTLALVRLAALVAVGGAVPSYGAQADAAVDAGATAAEIVAVLVAVTPSSVFRTSSRPPRSWRWHSGTTPTTPWNPNRADDSATAESEFC